MPVLDRDGQPLENTAIVEAMRNVSLHDSPESRAMLFRLLLDCTLVAATPDAPERPEDRVAQEGESVALVIAQDEEGPLLPLFTSEASLLRWRPEGGGCVAMAASAFFQMVVAGPPVRIALDPGSPTWGILLPHEVDALAHGRLPVGGHEVVAEPTQVMIGRPATPPAPAVLDAVRAALAGEADVEAGWLCAMQIPGLEAELVVVARITGGPAGPAADAVLQRIADASVRGDEGARVLSFISAYPELEASLTGGTGDELYRR